MNWLKEWFAKIVAYVVGFFSGRAHQKWKDRAKNEKAQRKAIEEDLDIANEPSKRGSDLIDSL